MCFECIEETMNKRHKELLLGLAFIAVATAFAAYQGATSRPANEIQNVEVADAENTGMDVFELAEKINTNSDEPASNNTPLSEPEIPTILKKDIRLAKGDTLTALLVRSGISRSEAYEASRVLSKVYDLRGLKAGQVLHVETENVESSETPLTSLSFSPQFGRSIVVEKDTKGILKASKKNHKVTPSIVRAKAVIKKGFSLDAQSNGVPNKITNDVIRLFSYSIDFKRHIKKNDEFEVAYETLVDETTGQERSGNILFAQLTLSKKPMKIYRHKSANGHVDYYNEEGKCARKSLMKTPVRGARMTSKFGIRKHPITKRVRMHAGVDFAARTGTPVMAAGDGVVAFVGRKGGYGKYILVRHNNEYCTAYAHLSRYANISVGSRVTQKQVIGYVGTTGQSTGPHLHFEVHRHGRQVNPMGIQSIPTEVLNKKELQKFQVAKAKLDQQVATLSVNKKFA